MKKAQLKVSAPILAIACFFASMTIGQAQQPVKTKPTTPVNTSGDNRIFIEPARTPEDIALRAKVKATRKRLGPTHPDSMRAVWQLAMYDLKAGKYSDAETALRYLNDAASKNAAGSPVSLAEIQVAYATAVNGIRTGVATRVVSGSNPSAAKSGGPNTSSATAGSAANGGSGTASGGSGTARGGSGSAASGPSSSTATGASSTSAGGVLSSAANSGAATTSAPKSQSRLGERTMLDPQAWKLACTIAEEFEAGPTERPNKNVSQVWFVRSKVSPATGFGNLTQTVDPTAFLGKRIKFSALVKTEDVKKAQLWLRLDDKKPGVMVADNMINRPIAGSTDWNRYECVLQVPSSTSVISAGLILSVTGQAWIKEAAIEEVGPNVPTTETQATGS